MQTNNTCIWENAKNLCFSIFTKWIKNCFLQLLHLLSNMNKFTFTTIHESKVCSRRNRFILFIENSLFCFGKEHLFCSNFSCSVCEIYISIQQYLNRQYLHFTDHVPLYPFRKIRFKKISILEYLCMRYFVF